MVPQVQKNSAIVEQVVYAIAGAQIIKEPAEGGWVAGSLLEGGMLSGRVGPAELFFRSSCEAPSPTGLGMNYYPTHNFRLQALRSTI